MRQVSREIIRNARRAADDAEKVVLMSPNQFEGLLDLISDLVKETEMLKTEVENLLDRVNELEKQNKAVDTSKTYSTSPEKKTYSTSDKKPKFTSFV